MGKIWPDNDKNKKSPDRTKQTLRLICSSADWFKQSGLSITPFSFLDTDMQIFFSLAGLAGTWFVDPNSKKSKVRQQAQVVF